jgi:4-hydroxybenzoate polyprenyltransferase
MTDESSRKALLLFVILYFLGFGVVFAALNSNYEWVSYPAAVLVSIYVGIKFSNYFVKDFK